MPTRSLCRLLAGGAAVFAGLALVALLSFGTDQLFHDTGVFPPMGEPMLATGPNLLALGYRFAYAVAAGFLVARLAPQAPMRHVLILGLAGTALGILGAVVTLPLRLSPAWMPVMLAATALPLTWLGGAWAVRTRPGPGHD